MCSDLGETSRGCAFYSATGFIFTLFVGILIHTQSFFIAGIEDAGKATGSAFGAMGMFLVTFIASLVGIWYDSHKSEKIEDEGEYQLARDDVPTYGTSS